MLCTKYGKWVHGRCTNIKVSSILAKGFACERFVEARKVIVKTVKE